MFKKLRAILDETDFDELLGISGGVTLIFVIDTTGSMSDEIAAAKEIVKAIAAHPRDSPVDFILSPFNDPSKLRCLIHSKIYLSLLTITSPCTTLNK